MSGLIMILPSLCLILGLETKRNVTDLIHLILYWNSRFLSEFRNLDPSCLSLI
ncbi:hypothetical protein HanXRQr2_Chr01g0009481 [Helianthus annuus]|uniref:Uncharacterized protein n=1 Tax=Helianthus annuus TaxID=4232 RepID=A0A9K3JTF2_HELAN|nr:hypothetical protein HanXRQr2_Chr01g0009481 [Helianthus annuus]